MASPVVRVTIGMRVKPVAMLTPAQELILYWGQVIVGAHERMGDAFLNICYYILSAYPTQ